jgi:hypothetical protein
MIREAYKLVNESEPERPRIVRVEVTDIEGVSWQEAKKQLRGWYLNQAKALRTITKDSYFNK